MEEKSNFNREVIIHETPGNMDNLWFQVLEKNRQNGITLNSDLGQKFLHMLRALRNVPLALDLREVLHRIRVCQWNPSLRKCTFLAQLCREGTVSLQDEVQKELWTSQEMFEWLSSVFCITVMLPTDSIRSSPNTFIMLHPVIHYALNNEGLEDLG